MKFWNYVSEIILFDWLVRLFKKHEHREEVKSGDRFVDNDLTDDFDVHDHYYGHTQFDHDDYGYTQSADDFLDEQDDYDMMDDF